MAAGKLTKQDYRKAAMHMFPSVDPTHHPTYSKKTQAVSWTRVPAGAWVETWVWVPQNYALMIKSQK
jgi:hypothetical protein